MRAAIVAHVRERDGAGLHPLVREAIAPILPARRLPSLVPSENTCCRSPAAAYRSQRG